MSPVEKGQVLKTVHTRAHAARMADLEQTLGTDSAAETARVALFFGVTIGRDMEVLDKLGLDLSRTLMGGHEIEWNRPFEPDEDLEVTVSLGDMFDKGDNRFAIVESVYATPAGEEIQRQRSTFIMRGVTQ